MYTHVQFIAYEVPTVTYDTLVANSPWISGWDPGQECLPVPDLPTDKINQTPLDPDAKKRLRRLANVVNYARFALKHSTWSGLPPDNYTTLKVLVLPEFYFRPPTYAAGLHNTYKGEVAEQIWSVLAKMFKHGSFSNWLFICGTVMYSSPPPQGLPNNWQAPLYCNTAPIVWGGPKGSISHVEKWQASGIDGVPPDQTPGTVMGVRTFIGLPGVRLKRIFEKSGVSFGLDICLDHYDDPYYNVVKGLCLKENKRVKFHILTAGGMTINLGSVAAKSGGYIFRNDGQVYDPNQRNSELYKVKGYLTKKDYQTYEEMSSMAGEPMMYERFKREKKVGDEPFESSVAVLEYIPGRIEFKTDPGPMTLSMPGSYASFDQSIVFYPPVPVPL